VMGGLSGSLDDDDNAAPSREERDLEPRYGVRRSESALAFDVNGLLSMRGTWDRTCLGHL